MNNSPPQAAYVHIPFCRRRCYYCDFPVSVLGSASKTSGMVESYVEVLCQEIDRTINWGKPLETVFFGGGTPSLLAVEYLQRILERLDKHFGITSGAEISLEMDPGTFTLEEIQGYVRAGVNRVSLGVQAFQDDLLRICGRSHSTLDIFAAVDLIRQVGISNLSLDLISGLPHQTPAQWQDSLMQAVGIAPQHLSCYDLVLEPVTAFGKKYELGETPLPSDETTAEMYCTAQSLLSTAGYEHYEISNYAQPSYQCRHNRVYWENRSYYAFGMGAASYLEGKRFTRPRTRKDYAAWVEKGCRVDTPPLSSQDLLLETLMLGLRLAEGVSLRRIAQEFGEDIRQKILPCLDAYVLRGWVVIESDRIRLRDPEGFLFSNVILSTLFKQFQ
jgi:oxygen-independent coproporphyrinogen-3 oxidase